MTKLVLLGAGKIGDAIVHLLSQTGDYQITVADSDQARLDLIPEKSAKRGKADIRDAVTLKSILAGQDVVLSACPYYLTPVIAAAAKECKVHYLDLTEDVESTRTVQKLSQGADRAFIPQCGLAPGFISIAAHDVAKRFDELREVNMRVGALPLYPTNALKYNLTWSTDGLINEYCNPCLSIRDGQQIETLPLEEMEHFSLEGVDYEAFNTSGGLGTLTETLHGKVENLNYKTVRYPGHRDIMKMLVRDLRLDRRRDLLKDVMEAAIPMTLQDVVLVFVTVSGMKSGRLMQETFVRKIYAQQVAGKLLSAIQLTTASGICTMVDMLVNGKLPQAGFVKQEQASLDDFLANRFGKYYGNEYTGAPAGKALLAAA
ncbi:MAG: saccharopine dehydrogenase C-terminal domain-containing protein [Burkholderiales bacterium]|nr:saccharopine dehydrogenase C-terminal domain-containing protein [Burkholderiales bacterium]